MAKGLCCKKEPLWTAAGCAEQPSASRHLPTIISLPHIGTVGKSSPGDALQIASLAWCRHCWIRGPFVGCPGQGRDRREDLVAFRGVVLQSPLFSTWIRPWCHSAPTQMLPLLGCFTPCPFQTALLPVHHRTGTRFTKSRNCL